MLDGGLAIETNTNRRMDGCNSQGPACTLYRRQSSAIWRIIISLPCLRALRCTCDVAWAVNDLAVMMIAAEGYHAHPHRFIAATATFCRINAQLLCLRCIRPPMPNKSQKTPCCWRRKKRKLPEENRAAARWFRCGTRAAGVNDLHGYLPSLRTCHHRMKRGIRVVPLRARMPACYISLRCSLLPRVTIDHVLL